MKKMVQITQFLSIYIVILFGYSSVYGQTKAEKKGEIQTPIQCLTTHIDADKDAKPVLENTGDAEWDNLQYTKRMSEWQKRDNQRNPKSQDRVIEPTPVSSVETQTVVSTEVKRINPIQYIIDKGLTTKAKIQKVAPHFPFLEGDANNETIANYLETALFLWSEQYPKELAGFYNEIMSQEEMAHLPSTE